MHRTGLAVIQSGMSQSEIAGLPLNWIETSPRTGTEAATVVLLHPVGWDLTYWDRQIDTLGERYRVVALDLPGHGRSAGTPEDCSLARMVERLAAFLEHVSTAPVHLAGISFGSMLAQELVLARPDLVRSLVLMATTCNFADPVRDGMRARADLARTQGMAALVDTSLARWFTGSTRTARPDLIDRVTKTLLSDDPRVHAAVWDALSRYSTQQRLAQIACPTLILVGELDPSTTPADAEIVRAGIRGAQLQVFADASHMVQLEAAEKVNAAMRAFLDAQQLPAAAPRSRG